MAPLPVAVGSAAAAIACVALLAVAAYLGSGSVPSGLRTADVASLEAPFLAGGAAGVLDSDRDGLADAIETILTGSDPLDWDTSGDGVPDGWLHRMGVDPSLPGAGQRPAASPPVDALPGRYGNTWPGAYVPTLAQVYSFARPATWNESSQGPFDNRLDPRDWDHDDDGVPDGWLLNFGLDPRGADLDASLVAGGLTLREAFEHATDPRKMDSDGDGLPDRVEIDGAPNPRGTPARFPPSDPSRRDTSGTGVCDGYLVAHGIDPTKSAAAYADQDKDGATTAQEWNWTRAHHPGAACGKGGLDPMRQASGTSPLADGWLIRFGLDPLKAGVENGTTQSAATDARPPGAPAPASDVVLRVRDEYESGRPVGWSESEKGPWWGGTDPSAPDTDKDGLGDAYELAGYGVSVSAEPGMPPVAYIARSRPTDKDGDGDGLLDGAEAAQGTDPQRADTDFDGLDDRVETALELDLDPTKADTAGDLLRDGARYALLAERSAQARQDPRDPRDGPSGSRTLASWASLLPGAADMPRPLSPSDVAALFAPDGNADGDAWPNALDRDMDNDGLDNGWEVDPRLYARSPFGAGSLPRAATDPLNPDTDGDGLPDGWEVEHGRVQGVTYSMDPARFDSDGDGLLDSAEDPDGDSIVWYSYPDGAPRVERRHVHGNLEEHRWGTDPNDFDSDGDGLGDGWKVFWGLTYPTMAAVPTQAVRPLKGTVQAPGSTAAQIFVASYERIVAEPEQHLPWEQVVGAPFEAGVPLHRVLGLRPFTLHDAQALGTNPYERDTDRDGMDDWWEGLHATLLPGTGERGGCKAGPGPSPIEADPAFDLDGDGVLAREEHDRGGSPRCTDSDLGGVPDQEELPPLDLMDPSDDVGLQSKDSDGDGVQDFDEIRGRLLTVRGVARIVRSDPRDVDTDGDGLLDGRSLGPFPADNATAIRLRALGIAYLLGEDGYEFWGERSPDTQTDPSNGDDARIGVPTGWLWTHSQSLNAPSDALQAPYRLGRPAWWHEGTHGVWWGGASPGNHSALLGRTDRDLDGDLLQDWDARGEAFEDPMPAANALNVLRKIDWPLFGSAPPASNDPLRAPNELAARLLAQAHMNPAPGGRVQGVLHPEPAADNRPKPRLEEIGLSTTTLVKGKEAFVSGRLVDASGTGIPGVAVEARINGIAFGAGVTQSGPVAQAGRFSFAVAIAPTQSVELPAGTVYRGTTGTVEWTADASAVPVGARSLLVLAYGNATRAPPDAAIRSITVRAESRLEIELPETIPVDTPVTAQIRLTDSAGSPLRDPVYVAWDGTNTTVLPASDGTASVVLPGVRPSSAGLVTASAGSLPADAARTPARSSDTVNVRRQVVLELETDAVADAGGTLAAQARLASVLTPTTRNLEDGVPLVFEVRSGNDVVATVETTTSGGGRALARLALPQTTAPGEAEVTVRSAPMPHLAGGTREAGFDVRSLPLFTAVSLETIPAGEPVRVKARLVEPGCQPTPGPCQGLPAATVRVRLGSTESTVMTDTAGRLDVTMPSPAARGLVLQQLSFEGDAVHAAARHAGERSLVGPTHLEVAAGSVSQGGLAEVTALLRDAYGAPVGGAPVRVRWGTDASVPVLTGADGVARLARPDAAPLGPVPVHASFAGLPASGLGPSSAGATWSVLSSLQVSLDSGPVTAGQAPLRGVLRHAATGAPVPGMPMVVHVDGEPLAAQRTDESGRFQATPPSLATDLPRSWDVVATFPGTDRYPAVATPGTIRLVSPTMADARGPAVVVAGEPFRFMVDLLDGRGERAQGGLLLVRVGDVVLGEHNVTDGPIVLFLDLPSTLRGGRTALEVSYTGSDTHAAASTQVLLDVIARTTVSLTADAVRAGGTARVHALVTNAGTPAAGRQVLLRTEGGLGLVATTDADGRATFEVPQADGAAALAVRVAGDGQASGALATAHLVPLQPAAAVVTHGLPTATWLAAGLAFVGAVTATVAFLSRRHPLAKALVHARRAIAGNGPFGRRIVTAYRALEDAAIALELLDQPARTPRGLQEVVAPTLPAHAHEALETLIQSFEAARYDVGTPSQADAERALAALDRLLHSMRKRALRGWGPPEVAA